VGLHVLFENTPPVKDLYVRKIASPRQQAQVRFAEHDIWFPYYEEEQRRPKYRVLENKGQDLKIIEGVHEGVEGSSGSLIILKSV